MSQFDLPGGERVSSTTTFWDEFGPVVLNLVIIAVAALLLAATR